MNKAIKIAISAVLVLFIVGISVFSVFYLTQERQGTNPQTVPAYVPLTQPIILDPATTSNELPANMTVQDDSQMATIVQYQGHSTNVQTSISSDTHSEPQSIIDNAIPAPGNITDYNNDGLTDIIMTMPDKSRYVFLNTGTNEKPIYSEGVKIE